MNHRNMFSFSVITALGVALLPGSALAQQKSLKEQLVGVWTIVSWEQMNKDGSKFHRFGFNPKGVHVFDANGRFFIQFARSDLPKFAANDPMKTTEEENKAVMEGLIAYHGNYSVNEADRTIILHAEVSSFPNQVGIDQKRIISFITANELKYKNSVPLMAGGQIQVVFRRAATFASK
jgi:hypothetical protein